MPHSPNLPSITIRIETSADQSAVSQVNRAAFPTAAEAGLVDSLREQAKPLLSLVAECEKHVVGHIMFSPVELDGYPELNLMGLAPMAVLPEYQRQGIGSVLVRAGIEECRQLGTQAIVVLGHPEYYPRFGFRPAAEWGIACEYDVPPEAFMLLEIEPIALDGTSLIARYHPAFSDL